MAALRKLGAQGLLGEYALFYSAVLQEKNVEFCIEFPGNAEFLPDLRGFSFPSHALNINLKQFRWKRGQGRLDFSFIFWYIE